MQGVIQHQDLRPDLSVVEIAYRILKDRREPIKYRELVEQIIELRGLKPGQDPAKAKARIHTELNIDRRFVNQGKGLCGLREWSVKPPSYKVLEVSAVRGSKSVDRLRSELEAVAEEDSEDDDYEEDAEDMEELEFLSDDDDDDIDEDDLEDWQDVKEPEEPKESKQL